MNNLSVVFRLTRDASETKLFDNNCSPFYILPLAKNEIEQQSQYDHFILMYYPYISYP